MFATTTTGVMAVAMAAGALGVLDYSVVPLLVAISARLGVIHVPPSMEWAASAPSIAVGAAVYGLSIVSARAKRPQRLKVIERAVGLPVAALAMAAVGVAAASNAGLHGHLLGGQERDAVLHTSHYSANDVTVLVFTGLVAAPMALAGKGIRTITRRFPRAKSIQSGVAVVGVSLSAVMMRMPAQVRFIAVAVMVLLFAALVIGIVRRAMRLIRWWHDEAPSASSRERLAVGLEALVPGAGYAVLGNPYHSLPRFVLTGLLLLVLIVFSVVGAPLYVYVSLGKALSLASELTHLPKAPPDHGDGDKPAPETRGPGLPSLRRRAEPVSVRVRADTEW